MTYINESTVIKAIESNNLKHLNNYDSDDVFEILISLDRFDKIGEIYDNQGSHTDELKDSIFYAVVRFVIDNNPNTSAINALEFLIEQNNKEIYEYELDDEEFTYFMCCYSGNIKTLELFHKLGVKNIDWGKTLFDACHYLQVEIFDFIIDNFKLSHEDMIEAFGGSLTPHSSSSEAYDEDKDKFISTFINKLKLDVNSKSESEWGYLYLDCLSNAPHSSKHFYIKDFDNSIISSKDFWREFLEESYLCDKWKSRYKQAFKDMNAYSIDTKEIETIFRELGYEELASEVF